MNNPLQIIVDHLVLVSRTTIRQIFVLFGPWLVLALIMNCVSQLLRDQSAALFGWDFWVYLTCVGTVIHEMGHALFALLFGHRLEKVRLFDPDPRGRSLGYVRHSYNRRNLYHIVGNFFIGVGPIILGSGVIFLGSKWLIGADPFSPFGQLSMDSSTLGSLDSLAEFAGQAFACGVQLFSTLTDLRNLADWKFYLFVYIAFAVGAHLRLSVPDIQNAWTGFVAVLGLIFGINLFALFAGVVTDQYVVRISRSFGLVYAIMVFTIALSLLFSLMFAAIRMVRQLIRL